MGKTVLTFGEIMMRLSPKDHLRIEQATEFDVRYGGAEANTAQLGVGIRAAVVRARGRDFELELLERAEAEHDFCATGFIVGAPDAFELHAALGERAGIIGIQRLQCIG